MISKNKYLKYKKKYLETKMVGGGHTTTVTYRGVQFPYDDFRKRCKQRLVDVLEMPGLISLKKERSQLRTERTKVKQKLEKLKKIIDPDYTVISTMEQLRARLEEFRINDKNLLAREEEINVRIINIRAEPINETDYFIYGNDTRINLEDFQKFENNGAITELFKSYLTKPNNFDTTSRYRFASCLDHVYKMPRGSPYLSSSSSLSVAYEYALNDRTIGDLICIGEYHIPNEDIATSVDEIIAYLEELYQKIRQNPPNTISTEAQHCFTIENTTKRVFNIKNIVFELINNKNKLVKINKLQEKIPGQTTYEEDQIEQILYYTFKLREYDLICNPQMYLTKMYIFKCDTFDTMWQYEKNKGYYIGPYRNNKRYQFEYNDVPNYRLIPLLTDKFVDIQEPIQYFKPTYTIMTVNLRAGLDILGRSHFNDTSSGPVLLNGEKSKMNLLVAIILKKDCDIICIQEFGYQQDSFLDTFYEEITTYNIHYINTHKENIAILVKKKYNTTNEDIGVIPTSSCPTDRNYILLRIHSLNITILNVHMCGGGFDDTDGSSPDNAKSRDIEFILKLFPKIDIICGDFNGDKNITRYIDSTKDYVQDIITALKNSYIGEFAKTIKDDHFKYILQMIDINNDKLVPTVWSNIIELIESLNQTQIDKTQSTRRADTHDATKLDTFIKGLEQKIKDGFYSWINKPFIQLSENGYLPSTDENEQDSHITTPHGTQVDYIYYNQDSITKVSTELVKLMDLNIDEMNEDEAFKDLYRPTKNPSEKIMLSDHNGLITTFTIKPKSTILKEDLNKTQYKVTLSNGTQVGINSPIDLKISDPKIEPAPSADGSVSRPEDQASSAEVPPTHPMMAWGDN